jgi:cobaltochelatase CobT
VLVARTFDEGSVMKGRPTIAGFFSYVHAHDEFENGRIFRRRERLEQAIRSYSGLREFRIFQDWQDIEWGKQWERVIADSIENSMVLFSVMTPSYFHSEPCRKELLAFKKQQEKVG